MVAELRARVEERRRSGLYPPGFEEDLADIYTSILSRRGRRLPDLTESLRAVDASLSFDPARIPVTSERSGGEVLHRAVASLVGRQVQGVLEQVRDFALPVSRALEEIVDAFGALHAEVMERLDAVYERQAIQERAIVQGSAWPAGPARGTLDVPAWWSVERLEEECRGPRYEVIERFRDVARRLVDHEPALDLACGRGELLELLAELGVRASGLDRDEALLEVASGHGLTVERGEPVPGLMRTGDSSLGAVLLWRSLERMGASELVQVVALAGRKVRPGGRVLVEGVNPQAGGWAHPALHDPAAVALVPPGRVMFLFREAGFSAVDLEWRAASGEPPGDTPGGSGAYLVTATR